MRLSQIIFPIQATDANIAAAKEFLFDRWKERAVERGLSEPADLTSACKFASLFAQKVFGGEIRGNPQHQYVVVGDKIVDLTFEARDVQNLLQRHQDTGEEGWFPSGYGWDEWRGHPHAHDPIFFNNREHRESLRSCRARVDKWVEEFARQLGRKP